MVRIREQMKHHHRRRHDGADGVRIEPTEHGPAAEDLKRDLDGLLHEIDAVLEEDTKA
jgi:hypothetical protein